MRAFRGVIKLRFVNTSKCTREINSKVARVKKRTKSNKMTSQNKITSDTLEKIEHLIENSFTLKSNEFDDVLIKNVKFSLISYETTFLATQNPILAKILC